MKFSKWSGLGNDFIFVSPEEAKNIDAVALCNRRFGIGADGVIIISPLGGNDFSMRIINSDGSEAAMCGNASRCAAKYIYNNRLVDGKRFKLHTISRTVETEVLDDGRVCVDMGEPGTFLGTITLAVPGQVFRAETVSMGNPHAVIFVDDINKIELEKWGALLECDAQFPDRCNIEFAQVIDENRIRMRVWERGCGVTAACGTGSCATMVAACKCGLVGENANIVLDGGVLNISYRAGGHVFMTGEAKQIFTGEIL